MKLIKYLFNTVTIIIVLNSCYTKKKAITQTNKALLNYPAVVANIARTAFPCDTVNIDSTDFNADVFMIMNTTKKVSDSINNLAKTLKNRLDNMLSDSLAKADCPDLLLNLEEYSKERDKEVIQLSNTISSLQNKIKNIRPIKETTLDHAIEWLLRDSLNNEHRSYLEYDAKYKAEKALRKELQDKIKGKILIPWWWIIIVVCLFVISIFFNKLKLFK